MKSWSYFISIPLVATLTVIFWVHIVKTINSGMFDALIAWILLGLVVHAALIGISYHAYRTVTGTWVDARRRRSMRKKKRKEKRANKK